LIKTNDEGRPDGSEDTTQGQKLRLTVLIIFLTQKLFVYSFHETIFLNS